MTITTNQIYRFVVVHLWGFTERVFKVLSWIALSALLETLHLKTGIVEIGIAADVTQALIVGTVAIVVMGQTHIATNKAAAWFSLKRLGFRIVLGATMGGGVGYGLNWTLKYITALVTLMFDALSITTN